MRIMSLSQGRGSIIFGRLLSMASSGKYDYLIASLSPDNVNDGSADTLVSVFGGDFTATSQVWYNGIAYVTAFIGINELQFTILAADLTSPGYKSVQVIDSVDPTLTSNTKYFGVNFLAPTLASVNPPFGYVEEGSVPLAAVGTNFYNPQTLGYANSAVQTTAVTSATAATVTISAALMLAAGDLAVDMRNPLPGGGITATQTFQRRYRAPTLVSLNPSSTEPDVGMLDVDVIGTYFYNGASVINVDGTPVPTTWIDATTLRFTIDTSILGTFAITVSNPTTSGGGGTTGAINFAVSSSAAPTLDSISPTSQNRYKSAFELTCTGPGDFTGSSVVELDGVPLVTIYDSPTQLRATVTKASNLIAAAKNVTVTDVGGTSAPQVLTIAAWTPTDIAGATGRFRPRVGEMTENPVGFAQTLTNLVSPGVRNVTQATAGNRPVFIAADPTFNNKPSIQRLSPTNQYMFGTALSTYVTDTTKLYLVVGTTDSATGPTAVLMGTAGGTHGIHSVVTTVSSYRLRCYDGSFDETAATPPVASAIPFGTASRLKGTHVGGNIQIEMNGSVSALVASGVSTAPQMASALQFFMNTGTAGFNQRLCEVVIGNAALSADDEDCWKNYVEDEYGIPA